MTDDLKGLRAALDEVDRRIIDALAERDRLIGEVARAKAASPGAPTYDPDREAELAGRLLARARAAGLDETFVSRIFREVLDHSVSLQQAHRAGARAGAAPAASDAPAGDAPLVVYQGGEGSYSQLAASRHFGGPRLRGCESFEQMLRAVRDGEADRAMLPIENTTAGSINEAYDLLARFDLVIVGEQVQRVDHCLVGLRGAALEGIRRVYSHPVALAQCDRFLRGLAGCKVESFVDTALAVDKVRDDGDPAQAAIASAEAAALRGLSVIARGVADQAENYTRFVVVAREPVAVAPGTPCKTAAMFATRHVRGALVQCLQALAERDLNLTKLESRPRRGTPFEYLFYVDFEGNLAEARVQEAVADLRARASYLKVLGSYPATARPGAAPASG